MRSLLQRPDMPADVALLSAGVGPDFLDTVLRPFLSGVFLEPDLATSRRFLDLVLTSPLPRARHTAELLIEALEKRPELRVNDALRPGETTAAAIAAIDKQRDCRQLAIVGHEPGIGMLAAHLAGLSRPLPFKKGAVACIELDSGAVKGGGTLRWFMPPRLLRRITT